MNKILAFIVLTLTYNAAFATGQIPERIIVRGDTLLLYTLPFEKADSVRRAALRKRLQETKADWTTASLRGYCGLWRMDKDTLRLEAIYDGKFKKEVSGDGVFRKGEAATWFSGDLRVVDPESKTVYYQPDGFEHYYKQEIVYTIGKGVRKSTKTYANRLIGDPKVFYEQTIPAISKTFNFPPLADSTVYRSVFIAFSATPNKIGKITQFDRAKMLLYKQDSTKEIVTDVFHPYLRELQRRLEAAEPYSLSIHGKVRPITMGIQLRSRENAKKGPQ